MRLSQSHVNWYARVSREMVRECLCNLILVLRLPKTKARGVGGAGGRVAGQSDGTRGPQAEPRARGLSRAQPTCSSEQGQKAGSPVTTFPAFSPLLSARACKPPSSLCISPPHLLWPRHALPEREQGIEPPNPLNLPRAIVHLSFRVRKGGLTGLRMARHSMPDDKKSALRGSFDD